MKRLKLLLVIVAIFGATNLFAQLPDTLWTKIFPNLDARQGPSNMMQPTFDGGFVILANTGSSGAPRIIKTDSAGNLEWIDTLWQPSFSTSTSIYQTSDSGFILTGSAFGVNTFLYKLDPNGDSMWLKYYDLGPGDETEWGSWVEQTSDGGYIVTGYFNLRIGYDVMSQLTLLKTDSIGNVVWSKVYGYPGYPYDDYGSCVRQTPDGGYIIGGTTESFAQSRTDMWLLRTNSNGDTLWTRTFNSAPGPSSIDWGYEVEQTQDGGFILVGRTQALSAGAFVVRVDSVGNTIWRNYYGGEWGPYWANSVAQTWDGGFVIAGMGEPGGWNNFVQVVKIDAWGEVLWSHLYTNSPNNYKAFSIHPTSDTCYAIAGQIGWSGEDRFVYLMKITDWYYISGFAKYYYNQNPVKNVSVGVDGYVKDTVLTDSAGYYGELFLPVLKNYTITPYKINSTQQGAITSYDAALILRHVVGMITLDSLQRIAADVSGNGQISSYDAALILRYAVGMISHFPVGARPGLDTVDWAFRPPSRTYDSLKTVLRNQNFQAILYGDPSGNWSPSVDNITIETKSNDLSWGGNLPTKEENVAYSIQNLENRKQETEFRVQDSIDKIGTASLGTSLNASPSVIASPIRAKQSHAESQKTESITFSIKVSNVKDVISADIILTYNPDEITIKDVTLGSSTGDYLIAWAVCGNTIRIGLAGASELNGNIELVKVHYTTKGKGKPENQDSRFKILSIVLNEGQELITAKSSDGVAGNKAILPTKFVLMANQPNPFTTQTAIRYALPAQSKVTLTIYDVSGTLVKTLVNQTQNPGFYSIQWDGTDELNQKVASGIYFYELKTNNFKAQKKLTILR